MTVKQLVEKSINNNGVKVVPLQIVRDEYFKMCGRFNREPNNEELYQFDLLVHTAVNLRGDI